MNDSVRKIFDMLGVEPNEKFKVKDTEGISEETYYLDEKLLVYGEVAGVIHLNFLNKALNGTYKIIKLPKKKKLRDLTEKELDKWVNKNCNNTPCDKCIFRNVYCMSDNGCWIHHKDLYSDKFLDQEIEVEE